MAACRKGAVMGQGKIIRTRRIGTVTFGCVMVMFGVLFLARIFVPWLHYEDIVRLWPLVFIFLGVEVLVGNHGAAKADAEAERDGVRTDFVYDKTAILLTVCLTLFAMVMAAVDFCIQCESAYLRF